MRSTVALPDDHPGTWQRIRESRSVDCGDGVAKYVRERRLVAGGGYETSGRVLQRAPGRLQVCTGRWDTCTPGGSRHGISSTRARWRMHGGGVAAAMASGHGAAAVRAARGTSMTTGPAAQSCRRTPVPDPHRKAEGEVARS